jgi:flagellin-like protein
MIKMCRDRKGISPVISTILMILIVIVGMSLVFAYVSVYTQNYQSGIGSSVLESLTIEDVCFNGTTVVDCSCVNNVATVSVYNSGLIAVTVNGIFIDGNATTPMGASDLNYHVYIPVGEQAVIHVQGPYPRWYSGQSYDIKVTTLRGSSFEKSFTA